MVARPDPVWKLSYTWVRNPSADWLLATVMVATWTVASWLASSPVLITGSAPDIRRALFQTLIALAGTFAGLVLTSVSILVNLLRAPVASLDEILSSSNKRQIGEVLLSVLGRLGAVFVTALGALLIDSSSAYGLWWAEVLVAVSLVAALSSIWRVVWVLRRLLAVTESGSG